MSSPSWLQKYYGKHCEVLHPEVVIDGQKVAVVRLVKSEAPPGFPKSGYVLIRKDGTHSGGAQQSLHEGVATQADMDRMTAIHQEADS